MRPEDRGNEGRSPWGGICRLWLDARRETLCHLSWVIPAVRSRRLSHRQQHRRKRNGGLQRQQRWIVDGRFQQLPLYLHYVLCYPAFGLVGGNNRPELLRVD